MGISFIAPSHAEEAIIRSNQDRERHERFLRSWATDERAISITSRAGIINVRSPGDAPAVLALEEANVAIDDVFTHQAVAEDLALAREDAGAEWNGDPRQNDVFDWTANPGDLFGEGLGWWQRSPGAAIADSAVGGSAPVRGAARWFMLGADAAMDAVSDRVIRAAGDASRETGYIDWTDWRSPEGPLASLGDFGADFVGEYLTGEDIGNKPFYGAVAELIQGNEVSLGSGYIAQSDLAPDVEAGMAAFERQQAADADMIYQAYENREVEGDEGWWANNAQYKTPYSEVLQRSTHARDIELNRLIDASPDQAAYGRPITQTSEAKQEAYGIGTGTRFGSFRQDEEGRGDYMQVSLGRVFAGVFSEPGTTSYHYASGSADFAKQIFADPLNVKAGKMFKAGATARRTVGVTEEGATRVADLAAIEKAAVALRAAPTPYQLDEISALKAAGVEPDFGLLEGIRAADSDVAGITLAARARKTVDSSAANRWLTGSQSQPMVTALTEATTMRQIDAVLSNVKGRIPANLRGQLRNAETEMDVIDALLPHVPQMNLVGNMQRSAELATYGGLGQTILARPLSIIPDTGFVIVDKITNAALDRMHQINQRGVGAVVGMGERAARPMEGMSLRASLRESYGSNWGGRMVNNQSNTAIRTDDIDTGYRQVERLVRNAGLEADSMLAKTSNGRVIEAKNIDDLTAQLVSGEKIVGKVQDVDNAMYAFSQLSNGNGSGAFRAMREVYDSMALKMEMDGIAQPFIRAVTSMIEEQGINSKFFTDAVGETGKYPGVGFMSMVDGKAAIQPGPQLIYEMFSGSINVPDPRLLRRTLAEKPNQMMNSLFGVDVGGRRVVNTLTTKKSSVVFDSDASGIKKMLPDGWKPRGDLEDRAALRYARLYVSNIWKPMKLLRFGYIPKVVLGDEQARMTAAGLASMWAPGRITKGDSPLAYISYLLGSKRGAKAEDVTGNSMAAARQYKDTVNLHGNVYGEIGAMRSEHWSKVRIGDSRYSDGLATEIDQLVNDPIVQQLFSQDLLTGDNVALTKAWLLESEEGNRLLDTIAKAIGEQDPLTAAAFREGGEHLDNYLQWVNARAHLKAGGDYVFRDPNSGALMNSSGIGIAEEGMESIGPGITITRPGDVEITKAYGTGWLGDELDGGLKLTDMNAKDYKALRANLDERVAATMQPDGTSSIFPEAVKYESGGYAGASDKKLVERIVDTLMDYTVAKPAEVLNRAPAFKQFYWHALATRIPSMTDEVAEAAIKQAKDQGVWGRVKAIMDEVGEQPRMIDSLDDADLYAKSYAATATKDLLFDFAERKNFFDALGLISPFADAWLELFTSWGRLFANDPLKVRRPLKALDELRGSDPMEWGEGEFDAQDNGFFYENSYGQEVFALPFAAEAVQGLKNFGLDQPLPGISGDLPEMKMEIGLEGLNMIAGQFYPGVGPVITIPAAGLIPNTPEFRSLRNALSPFGLADTMGEELLSETIGGSPTLKRFINAWSQGKFYGGDDERIYNNTVGWIIRDMITSGEVTMEDLADPDLNAAARRDAEARAQDVYLIRGLTQFLAPAAPGAPQFIFDPADIVGMEEGERFTTIALQDSARAYYDIKENEAGNDAEAAFKIFTDRYGFDPTMTLVSLSEKSAKHGVTVESADFEGKHPETFDQYEMTAYYLQPDDPDDPFSYDVWSGEFATGDLTPKKMGDQLDEYQSRMAAMEYAKAGDDFDAAIANGEIDLPPGLTVKALRTSVLDKVKADIIDRTPAYEEEVNTFTNKERQTAISELRDWQNYSPISSDPTQKAVTTFFNEVWDDAFKAQLASGIGSSTANVLPFGKTTAVVGGDTWSKRLIVNGIILDEGDKMAADPANGYFATVWEEVIRPSIYDYREDTMTTEPEYDMLDPLKATKTKSDPIEVWG